jgi:hypothetical protein
MSRGSSKRTQLSLAEITARSFNQDTPMTGDLSTKALGVRLSFVGANVCDACVNVA